MKIRHNDKQKRNVIVTKHYSIDSSNAPKYNVILTPSKNLTISN